MIARKLRAPVVLHHSLFDTVDYTNLQEVVLWLEVQMPHFFTDVHGDRGRLNCLAVLLLLLASPAL